MNAAAEAATTILNLLRFAVVLSDNILIPAFRFLIRNQTGGAMMEASHSMGATTIFDLVLCLAQAVDLVSPLVADHHRRVAQITYSLGRQIHLPEDDLVDLVIAAALHDVGGLTRTDRLDALDFEYQDPYGHAVMGYLLLKPFAPFENSAQMVRFHHVAWQNGAGAQLDGVSVPSGSHLLQLADRVAVLIDPQCDVLEQAGDIVGKISAQAGERFVPQQVEAFKALAQKEAFWLDMVFLQDLHYLNRNL
jgi:response regulator RpfG family c-di-GMP phosphodiesterase